MAALVCFRAGGRSRLIYRPRIQGHHRGAHRGFTWQDYRDLLGRAHLRFGGPVVVIWDNLNVHRCSRLREYAPGQDEGIQVRHWTSWHRPLTLAMLALAFLAAVAVSAKPVRNTDPNRSVRSSDLIDLTVPEIRHLIALD
jgi:hypothetical protein